MADRRVDDFGVERLVMGSPAGAQGPFLGVERSPSHCSPAIDMLLLYP